MATRMSHKKILSLLRDAGLSAAVVRFSGGGDSGGVDSVTLYTRDDKAAEVDSPRCSYLSHHVGDRYVSPLNPALKPLGHAVLFMDRCIEDRYYSFNNDPYVNGTVEFDVAAGTVTLEATETTTQYYSDDEDDEGTDEVVEVNETLYPRDSGGEDEEEDEDEDG